MEIMRASNLFASAMPGEERCYYCGASCGREYPASEYVLHTFTNRDAVAYPGGLFACHGCVQSNGSGDDEYTMIDGSVKIRENSRGMQPRMYSWVLSGGCRLAATKAHIPLLRQAVLCPPEPPFAIVLADSGQKQLLFRGPVGWSANGYSLLLEDMEIRVDIMVLSHLLGLVAKLVPAVGKPALLEKFNVVQWTTLMDSGVSEEEISEWEESRQTPIGKLAQWLSPSKKEIEDGHH